jgi:hypothetical protein
MKMKTGTRFRRLWMRLRAACTWRTLGWAGRLLILGVFFLLAAGVGTVAGLLIPASFSPGGGMGEASAIPAVREFRQEMEDRVERQLGGNRPRTSD